MDLYILHYNLSKHNVWDEMKTQLNFVSNLASSTDQQLSFVANVLLFQFIYCAFHSFPSHPFVHWIHLSNIDDAICA